MLCPRPALLALFAAAGCAHTGGAGHPGALAADLPAADAQTLQLAALDHQPVRMGELPKTSQAALARLDDTFALRRFTLLWTGAEDVIAERLLEAEAKRRGVAVAALIEQEVDRKVGAPSEDEVRALYDAHAQLIGQPFAKVQASLTAHWHDDRVLQLKRALVDRLRASAEIEYDLPPPRLARHEVPAGPLTPMGPATAKVTIVVFGDYGCPFSAQARRLLTRLGALYPQQVRWIWRDFPVDAGSDTHPAAEGAYCAHEQHQFWAFHERLFERTGATQAADLNGHAAALGLDPTAFRDCLASPRPKLTIGQSQRDGQRLGVEATPTFFVNGQRLDTVLPLAAMQTFIERELEAH